MSEPRQGVCCCVAGSCSAIVMCLTPNGPFYRGEYAAFVCAPPCTRVPEAGSAGPALGAPCLASLSGLLFTFHVGVLLQGAARCCASIQWSCVSTGLACLQGSPRPSHKRNKLAAVPVQSVLGSLGMCVHKLQQLAPHLRALDLQRSAACRSGVARPARSPHSNCSMPGGLGLPAEGLAWPSSAARDSWPPVRPPKRSGGQTYKQGTQSSQRRLRDL